MWNLNDAWIGQTHIHGSECFFYSQTVLHTPIIIIHHKHNSQGVKYCLRSCSVWCLWHQLLGTTYINTRKYHYFPVKRQLTCCNVFIRLKDATYARYLLGGAWGVLRELVPKPNVLNPNPTPVHVVIPPLVGGGACRNSRRLIGYSSNSGVGSPFVGVMTCLTSRSFMIAW